MSMHRIEKFATVGGKRMLSPLKCGLSCRVESIYSEREQKRAITGARKRDTKDQEAEKGKGVGVFFYLVVERKRKRVN